MTPRLASLLLLLAPLVAQAEDAADPAAEWRLGLSDVAEYEVQAVTRKGDKEKLGTAKRLTVYGHDLRDDGQYLPVTPKRGDLARVLALRLPAPGEAAEKVSFRLRLQNVPEVRVTGTIERAAGADGAQAVKAAYKFASRGKAERTDKHAFKGGEATVEGVFDPTEGVFRRVRITLRYELRHLADKKKKPEDLVREFELGLKHVKRARYPEFQADVDAAIDRGVARLKAIQKEDGTFEPHGKWKVGTNALTVLTLVACGVPPDDPAVARPLATLFEQEPARTYERAVSLMAIDRCYTSDAEAARAERGEAVTPRRDLPPERLAWCLRVAAALEKGCSSKGSWGYPPQPRVLLRFDSSNTQYAVLGLHAATKLGYEVQEDTWLGVLRHFELVRQRKAPKGSVALVRTGEAIRDEASATRGAVPVEEAAGFRYATLDGYPVPWSSMTAAGISSISVARHQLRRTESSKLTSKVERQIDALLLGAWAWLDAHWGVDRHPEKRGSAHYHYFLYSLERAALLDRVKRVGGKDWYFEGAVELLARQKDDGGWTKDEKPKDTCLALLFLKRATVPLTGK